MGSSRKITLVILPGLNGTADLFKPFVGAKPSDIEIITVTFPTQQKKSYQELASELLQTLSLIKNDYILLGESFSGPIVLFAAQARPSGLVGIILVASFFIAPICAASRIIPWRIGFILLKIVGWLWSLFAGEGDRRLLSLLFNELGKVSSLVLADRVRSILSVNAEAALKGCEVPVIYLRATKDYLVQKKSLRQILRVKPDVQLAEFATSHFLLQNAPEQAWITVNEFVNKLSKNKVFP